MIDPTKIWSSTQLPTLPAVAIKLLELSRNPETEIRDIIATVKTDPALTAKILKSANSTFFGLATRVTSIERAVPLLGTTVVNSLALSFSLSESSMNSGPMAQHFQNYWRQSVVQAAAAEVFCQCLQGEGLPGEAFQSGLLMDLGRLAILKTISRDYQRVMELSATRPEELLSVTERTELGFDHGEIGAELMRRWGLPESLINASKQHHFTLEQLQQGEQNPLTIVLALAACVGDYYVSPQKGLALHRLRALAEQFLKYDDQRINELLAQIDGRVGQTAELFSINPEVMGDPADLMAEANAQLAQLAVREHVASTHAQAMHKRVEQEKNELESRHELLQRQALRDPLTGAFNRRFFDETLSREVDRCSRYGFPLAVLFTDVDRFKNLNDTYGHAFGDEVLKRISAALGETARRSDTVARYGGEEFVILVSEPTEKGLEKFAERVRARVESEQIMFQGQLVRVTVSVGTALTLPRRNDADVGQRLLQSADEAMYESKQNGRNQVHHRVLITESERQMLSAVTQRRFSRWLVRKQVLDLVTASKALLQLTSIHRHLGELAERQGLMSHAQVEEVLDLLRTSTERFGEVSTRLGYTTQDQIVSLLAVQAEDPAAVANIIKQMQLVDPRRMDTLLMEYVNQELQFRPRSAPATTCVAAGI